MMQELEQILREHAKRYPLMEPTDAVKLIYQNEFGGGHLIRDEEAALRYLREEYEKVEKDAALPSEEAIGNGLVRVHLAGVQASQLEELGRDFIRSAAAHQGSQPQFLEKLELLRQLTRSSVFSFSAQALEDYLEGYAQAGYPMVSHSPTYRQQYKPAYRVVKRQLG